MKKTLITLIALGGLAMGATETFDETYMKASVTLTLNVDVFKNIAGSNINTSNEVLPLFYFTGNWSNGLTYVDGNDGSLGIANNGNNASKSSFWGYYTKGDTVKNNQNHGLSDAIFTKDTQWDTIQAITIDFTYDSTLTNNVKSKGYTTHATQVTTTVTIEYNDGTAASTYTGKVSPYMWTTLNEAQTGIADNVYQFHATGMYVNESYVNSYKITGLQVVPEPATATLSLLALAGLCARRRRK